MAVRDSESYHGGLRLLFFRQGVVLERCFKLKKKETTLKGEVTPRSLLGVAIQLFGFGPNI